MKILRRKKPLLRMTDFPMGFKSNKSGIEYFTIKIPLIVKVDQQYPLATCHSAC